MALRTKDMALEYHGSFGRCPIDDMIIKTRSPENLGVAEECMLEFASARRVELHGKEVAKVSRDCSTEVDPDS